MAVSGVIGSSMVAPNASELFTRLAKPIMDLDVDESELKRLLKYMERTKLIELSVRDNVLHSTLTDKAHIRLNNVEIDEIVIKVPSVWDKKWRILIYDIPKEKKNNRYALLEQLHRLNFYKLQDSTWVYPFSCSKEILEILQRLEIEKYTTFIVGDVESKDESKMIRHYQLFKHA